MCVFVGIFCWRPELDANGGANDRRAWACATYGAYGEWGAQNGRANMKRDEATGAGSISKSIGICVLYGATSVAITFCNKTIFTSFQFPYPCFVVLVQISICIICLLCMHVSKLIELPPFSPRLARAVFPITLCWWTYVVTGIAALNYLNIPMFATLRKCTSFIVLVLESVVLCKQAERGVWLAISGMLLGGLIAGCTDFSFSMSGYLLVFICCFATALYLVLIIKIGEHFQLDTFGLLYYNNLLSLPLMLSYLLFLSDELSHLSSHPRMTDVLFWVFMLFSAAQATVLNIAIFLCTKLNSPLATTVTAQMKDFVTVAFGLFLFGDVHLNWPNLLGLSLSMVCSVIYSLIKLFAMRNPTPNAKRNPT